MEKNKLEARQILILCVNYKKIFLNQTKVTFYEQVIVPTFYFILFFIWE